MQVTVHHAKTNLSRLIAQAEAGEDVVIARGSQPAVRLVPVNLPAVDPKTRPRRVPGRLKGLVSIDERFFEPFLVEELDEWEKREL